MPIYEFYCASCHTVFSFLSRLPNTTKRPACPRCRRPRMTRRASSFAISSGAAAPADDEAPPGLEGLDDARLEQAMGELAREAASIPDDDPRGMAGLMRKLYERTGLSLGPGMEEAMRRLEAGEDPDALEAEMGELLDSEQGPPGAPAGGGLGRLRRRLRAPRRDDTLYEL